MNSPLDVSSDDLFDAPWYERGLCRKFDPEAWFPDPGQSDEAYAEPIAICKQCPVQTECLEWALDMERREDGLPLGHHSRHGIYGGLTPGQRHKLAKGAA